MKTVKVKGQEIQVPQTSAFAINTGPMLMKAHQNMIVLGKRGSGKSVAITNYLRMLREDKKLDRIFVISPTFQSNRVIMEKLGIDEEDVFDPATGTEAVEKVIAAIEKERDDYEDYLTSLERYKLLLKDLNSVKFVEMVDPQLMLEFFDTNSNKFTKPEPKYKHKGPPICALFVDDCQSTPLFRAAKFLNFITRHRHIGPLEGGGALGVSVFIALQNFSSTSGGCPRAVRNNATSVLTFGLKDKKELGQVYESVAGEIEEEKFMKAFEYATSEPHNFLCIDLHPKKEHPSMFRKNFNEFIIL
jgi:hypothetical protein